MDIDGHNPFLAPETYDLHVSNCPSQARPPAAPPPGAAAARRRRCSLLPSRAHTTTAQDLAKTNCVFVSPESPAAEAAHLELGDLVFAVRADAAVPPGAVGLNAVQRRACRVSSGDRVAARAFAPPASGFELAALHAEVDFVSKKAAKGPPTELDAADLGAHVLSRFAGQVLTAGQELTFEYRGTNFLLRVATLVAADAAAAAAGGADAAAAGPLAAHRGLLAPGAALSFEAPHGAGIKLAGGRGGAAPPAIFRHKEFNFEKLGIGGLDAQFEQIFRRAFASRIFPPAVLERLGIQHVKVRGG
jgi:vesicle-fusing ATPase